MTRVKEMMAQGINVAFGHDCVLDPWYALGSHDMLEVAGMGLHVAQMTGVSEMQAAFDAVTSNAAKVMNLPDYGLAPGCNADMGGLQAGDPVEALRLRANRLYVIRRGRGIAESSPHEAQVHLMGADTTVKFANSELDTP